MIKTISRILKVIIKKVLDMIIGPFGYKSVIKDYRGDYYLHKYSSYEEYKEIQMFWNKKKLNFVWADKNTLKRVGNLLIDKFGDQKKITGIAHGTRNGYELEFLKFFSSRIDVIGTDISDTAINYENTIQWDFHNQKNEWINSKDFVYTNSLDQSWQPKIAIQTWLNQIKSNGIVIIEHTESHGPSGASEMDPFGIKPNLIPYILTKWFGSQISISHSCEKKSNKNINAWLFVIEKNCDNVEINFN